MKTPRVFRSAPFVLSLLLGLTVEAQSPDSFNPNPDGGVPALLLQPDGKILVGGSVQRFGNQKSQNTARLNPDGTLDPDFSLPLYPYDFGLQTDGKVLTAGFNGNPIHRVVDRILLVRTDQNGGDLEMAPGSDMPFCLQQDGKILVPGTTLFRLNQDFTVDSSFNPNPNSGPFDPDSNYSFVNAVLEQPDRKILVAGTFLYLAGQNCTNFGRLNPDGKLDLSFNPPPLGNIFNMAVQPDGKILVAGYVDLPIARLNTDGSLDAAFNPAMNGYLNAMAIQADGRIIIGGNFTVAAGANSRTNLARLNADGSLDTSFDAHIGFPATIIALALQADGKIVVAGPFEQLGGQPRHLLGRLMNTEPATQQLSDRDGRITWLRGGTSPEVLRTSFDVSHDGGRTWKHLGHGTRIQGGWELRAAPLRRHAVLRARGFVHNSFFETYLGAPTIVESPQSRTNIFGTSVEFTADAGGTDITYQWLKNGTRLTDGGNVSGANTSSLTLSNVTGADTAEYSVRVGNSLGHVTSAAAALRVLDPMIATQPLGAARQPGQSAIFAIVPTGTEPFTYQWRKDGQILAGATLSTLTLLNLQFSDAAAYDVVVRNRWGNTVSQPALLTINQSLPNSFAAVITSPWGTPASPHFALQPDGKILVAGLFVSVDGQPRTNFARLNADGSLDSTFAPPAVLPAGHYGPTIDPLAVQGDGKIIFGGTFISVGGQPHTNLARLNPDGTLDASFSCNLASPIPAYEPGFVDSIAIRPDGKILVSGYFQLGGNTNIVQLNPDGSLDTRFNPGRYGPIPAFAYPNARNPVSRIALQRDGKILFGGHIVMPPGGWYGTGPGPSPLDAVQDDAYLVRLEPDGRPDSAFNFNADLNLTFLQASRLDSLLVQPDGKIVVGGAFRWLAGDFRTNLARLNPDGSLDLGFAAGADGETTSLALQADGRLLLAGTFNTVNGQSRPGLARLNPDSSLDPAFAPSTGPCVEVAVQENGDIFVTGFPNQGLASLNNTGTAVRELSYDRHTITWRLTGSSPQCWAATFDYSRDGSHWTLLGLAEPTTDGWQLKDASLPANSIIRARGFVINGGSSWVFRSTASPILAISDFQILPTHCTRFNALGPANRTIVVETSSDLVHWFPVATNAPGNGCFPFTDSAAARPARFYRLRRND